MTRYLIGFVIVVIAVYGLMEAWPVIAGPALKIESPADNAVFPGGIVVVRGVVKRASSIILNGAPLLHDQNGEFSSTLTFPRGGSIITLTVADRFGRTVTGTRNVFVPF